MAETDYTLAEIATGGAVLAAAIGFFFYASGPGGPSAADSYELLAAFRSAEGISVGTEVRLGGVQIGSVTAMELNPQTFLAETTFSVASDIILPDDSAISIASESLLGGSYVEVIPGGSPFNLEPGGEVLDTQSSVSLITLLLRFVGAAADE
ncbi:outer membrane lipid asymmetry maintenance protein MlaD [Rhodobacteraceae bacterium N5(2021)]|uniref:Outer membrane lipid asymmetry maintenance protein MlaD n=1 Tax=Gymnodinialimonas phycosphaerae TaxID=2841589 RepID=A0A975TX37_9RHOB|nr:outer membrane lipid asymmetry maintenance protein MlaD [Gymnodinialimonas phycosphaerae]MBY4892569.1 outer membrane lipid asymmetry maintenance protein MlaD [Gymnodinialimonas phycosphaerae]